MNEWEKGLENDRTSPDSRSLYSLIWSSFFFKLYVSLLFFFSFSFILSFLFLSSKWGAGTRRSAQQNEIRSTKQKSSSWRKLILLSGIIFCSADSFIFNFLPFCLQFVELNYIRSMNSSWMTSSIFFLFLALFCWSKYDYLSFLYPKIEISY